MKRQPERIKKILRTQWKEGIAERKSGALSLYVCVLALLNA